MNAAAYLLDNPAKDDHIALLTVSEARTYGELRRTIHLIGEFILRSGGTKRDRVVIIGENSIFWVSAYLGCLQAGCVAVPLAPNTLGPELDYILLSTEPRFLFLQRKYAQRVLPSVRAELTLVLDERGELPALGRSPVVSFQDLLAETRTVAPAYPDVEDQRDLAAIMFTSGSIGAPKGVMVSHRNIIANTASIIDYLGLTANDRVLAVLPFYYCFGTSLLHTHLRVRGSIVMENRFICLDKILTRMQETRCTGLAGVPSHYQILLRHSSLKKMKFPDLRWLQQAGGHLPAVFLRELRECLPETQIFVMYGQTEATARLSYLPPEMLDRKMGSIGKGIPGVRLQVLDETGTSVTPGQVGEIVAQGENIALGYWRDPEASRANFQSGSLRTGDLATVDEDGFIYVVDRAQDFLKCGGNRVSCRRIEAMLLDFDDLVEAAVVGIPDDVLGEAVKAFVTSRSGDPLVGDRLRRFCIKQFPLHLIPKEIVVLDALPKNSAGKVLKAALKPKEQRSAKA